MGGLDHICRVDVVVVGHVGMVMILQSHHEGNESVRWNLKGLQQVAFLKQQQQQSRNTRVNHLIINSIIYRKAFVTSLLHSFIYCRVHTFTEPSDT